MKDIEIAQQTKLESMEVIAEKLGIKDYIIPYGKGMAKVDVDNLHVNKEPGKLVLVTSINPTPSGEGKTTVTIGLGDALSILDKSVVISLREPSMGPVFGFKGGATGGGYSQVLPMENINLHFTGDMHAIGACHNLLSAVIDNHLYYGNELDIDKDRILWGRVMDINDRSLRKVSVGQKDNKHDNFYEITVASEIMAILCLSSSYDNLVKRLGNILIAYSKQGKPIYAKDLEVEEGLGVVLLDALKPNLVQTLEHTPVLMHGGPFANIAHGCNSVMATNLGLKLADYVITEAGFGADLGAEKFIDIKGRVLNKFPDAVVIVVTLKAIKHHGTTLSEGFDNVRKHIDTIKNQVGLPCVVAINKFAQDTSEDIEIIKNLCKGMGVDAITSSAFLEGGKGAIELAEKVISMCEMESMPAYIYKDEDELLVKIQKTIEKVYGGKDFILSEKAQESLNNLIHTKETNYPICMAKTPFSLSGDPKLLGAPKDFTLEIKDIVLKRGAGFIVIKVGNILTMPGLPKHSRTEEIKYKNGKIIGID